MSSPVLREQGRLPVDRLRIHQAIVDQLRLTPGDTLLDVGCGNGLTLATAASRCPELSVIGIDVDEEAVAAAESWLGETDACCRWFCGDLAAPLPLPDDSVTRVVCHDVLECVEDAGRVLDEAARVMRPGSVSVWSHVDYEAILVGGGDRMLTRRMVNAYADASYLKVGNSDAQAARKLAAMIDRSTLSRVGIDTGSMIATDLAGPGRRRIDDIARTVIRSADSGGTDVHPDEVAEWTASLERAEERGEFFYSQTAYIVTAAS